jgi:hypothetical protein
MTKIEKKRGPRPIYFVENKSPIIAGQGFNSRGHGARCTVDLVGF